MKKNIIIYFVYIIFMFTNVFALANKSIFNELLLEFQTKIPAPVNDNNNENVLDDYLDKITNLDNVSYMISNYGNTLFITHTDEYYDEYYQSQYEILKLLKKYYFDSIYQQVTSTDGKYFHFKSEVDTYKNKLYKELETKVKEFIKVTKNINYKKMIDKIRPYNLYYNIYEIHQNTYKNNENENNNNIKILNKIIQNYLKQSTKSTFSKSINSNIQIIEDYKNLGKYNYNHVKGKNIMFTGLYFNYCTLWTFKSVVKSFVKSHLNNKKDFESINLYIPAKAIMQNNFKSSEKANYNQYITIVETLASFYNIGYKVVENNKTIRIQGNPTINLYIIKQEYDPNFYVFYFNQKLILEILNQTLKKQYKKFSDMTYNNMQKFIYIKSFA